jgi:hypothetical protein
MQQLLFLLIIGGFFGSFKLQSTEGKTYLLRYDEETDEWT